MPKQTFYNLNEDKKNLIYTVSRKRTLLFVRQSMELLASVTLF